MKKIKLLNTFLIVTLLVTMITVFAPSVSAAPGQEISVIPPEKIYSTDIPCHFNGTTFDVDIYITNVTGLGTYDFWLYYNASLLEVTQVLIDTDPANPLTETQVAPAASDRVDTDVSVSGIVKMDIVWKAGVPTYTGSGVCARITFKIIYCPPQITADPQENNTVSCDLAFDTTWTKAFDGAGDPMLYDAFNDGYYEYTTEGKVPGAPVANFIFSKAFAYVGDSITCTDTSTPNGGTIDTWLWAIAGPATMTSANNGATMTFDCDGVGTVNVTLTVWDDENMSGTITKSIEQKEKLGCIFDLTRSPTQFCGQTTTALGEGVNASCDALSPDLNVTLFVEVSWNGKPVNHVLVAFEVIWFAYPDGTPLDEPECVLYRTAETDKDGIARIWFRVPTPCEGMMFGKWYAYASAKVQEVKQEDWMYFDVGYLVTLTGVVTTGFDGQPEDTFEYCEWIGVTVYLKTISWMPKYVKLIVVVYDDCDVPIGQDISGVWLTETATYCHPKDYIIIWQDAVHVPQWFYAGEGKVYVSAFTDIPSECGVPYCPEVSTGIALEWTAWP
jgi:PKD repeat protein